MESGRKVTSYLRKVQGVLFGPKGINLKSLHSPLEISLGQSEEIQGLLIIHGCVQGVPTNFIVRYNSFHNRKC